VIYPHVLIPYRPLCAFREAAKCLPCEKLGPDDIFCHHADVSPGCGSRWISRWGNGMTTATRIANQVPEHIFFIKRNLLTISRHHKQLSSPLQPSIINHPFINYPFFPAPIHNHTSFARPLLRVFVCNGWHNYFVKLLDPSTICQTTRSMSWPWTSNLPILPKFEGLMF